jgi:hypothetical protein
MHYRLTSCVITLCDDIGEIYVAVIEIEGEVCNWLAIVT